MIFNKTFKLSTFFLMAAGLLFMGACKTTKNTTDAIVTKAKAEVKNFDLEKALLWKIEGKGLTEPSYLYGTIHMIEAESFFWPAGTLAAFEECEAVAFEIDMNAMSDPAAMVGLMSKAMMADGKGLKDLYSEEDYNLVKKHFTDMGIPFVFMEKLKPMFLTVFASGDMKPGQGFGDDSGIKSYEMEFMDLAKESKKPVSGLESIEFQLSVFDSIPYQAQADMLLETIKAGDTEDDMMEQMVQMYKDQDVSRMVSFMSETEEAGIQGYEDILLYKRNRSWIPVMSESMSKGQVFFAVGAGHLGGEQGVIHLLKDAGYKLTPISQVK